MNIVALNSILLPLLILAVVPVLLHLFARSKPPVKNVSSIDFILKAAQRNLRMKRPKDIVLLILRTLIFLCIIGVFLRPFLFSGKMSSMFKERHVVVIVDRSASMGCLEGGQTRFASACAEASRILSDLSSNDKATVVWMGLKPVPIYPKPDMNIVYLQEELRKARVSSEQGDVDAALQTAVSMLNNDEVKQQIVVVSDFQKAQWKDASVAVPDSIELIHVKIGEQTKGNLGITRTYTEPLIPLVGEDVTLFCDVKNYSDKPVGAKVLFTAGAVRREIRVMVPAWGGANPFVTLTASKSGVQPYSFSLEADSLVDDNERVGIMKTAQHLKVAVIAPAEDKNAYYWQRALAALSWASVDHLQPHEIITDIDYDVVMISGVQQAVFSSIYDTMKNNLIIWSPRNGDSIPVLDNADADPKKVPALKVIRPAKPVGIKLTDSDDPTFKLLRNVEDYQPDAAFFSHLNLMAKNYPLSVPLVKYDDGAAALMKMGNNLFVWNMPLDPSAGNFSSRPSYIPFLSELILNNRSDLFRASHIIDYVPGARLILESKRGKGNSYQLYRGDTQRIEPREGADGNHLSFIADECGLYTWKEKNAVVDYQCVNLNPVESDLRTLDDSLQNTEGMMAASAGTIKDMSDGVDLFPFLIWCVVAFIVLEALTSLWIERT